jgi:DNA-binding transcriptional LysR family regulator
MTIRHMRIFIAVCQEKSITNAAKKLYLAQPAVSLAIKELEDHYHQKLFERFSRRIQITNLGEGVYQHALRIVQLFDELEYPATFRQYLETLRIGTGTAIGNLYMPRIIKGFKELHPNAKVIVTIDRGSLYPQYLIDNKIDMIILERLDNARNITSHPISAYPIVAVCHRDHPLAQKKNVCAEDFIGSNLLMHEKNNMTRNAVDAYFAKYNMKISPSWESIDVMSLLNAVNSNLGVSFLALNHINAVNYPNLVILNVEGFSAQHYINIYYHKDKQLTPIMREFIKYIGEIFESEFTRKPNERTGVR